MKELENKDSRIRVIGSKANHGLGYALNQCIASARGKYLARMDADDISHPKRFEEEISFLKDHPEYMWCGTNCKLVDDRGIWGEGVRPEEPGTDDYLKYSPYIHPTVMYRASLFKKVAGYDEGKKTARCEDYELFMRLFGLGYKGYNIQKCLLDYRVDRENYHNRSWKNRFHEGQVRYEGFRGLGILWPKGWLYIFRPMVSRFVPSSMIVRKRSVWQTYETSGNDTTANGNVPYAVKTEYFSVRCCGGVPEAAVCTGGSDICHLMGTGTGTVCSMGFGRGTKNRQKRLYFLARDAYPMYLVAKKWWNIYIFP